MGSRLQVGLFGLVCFLGGALLGVTYLLPGPASLLPVSQGAETAERGRERERRAPATLIYLNKEADAIIQKSQVHVLEKSWNASRKLPLPLANQTAAQITQRREFPDIPGLKFLEISTAEVTQGMTGKEAEDNFYRYLQHQDAECHETQRYGHVAGKDGGWDVCLAGPFRPSNNCLIYSFGIENDWTFDDAISGKHNCTVRAFDPSIKAVDHVRGKDRLIHFYHRGLAGSDRTLKRPRGDLWPVRTLRSHREALGDTNRTIDYLKIDVEFSEWESLRAMVEDGSLRSVKQLGFETHLLELWSLHRISTVTDLTEFYRTLHSLEAAGFRKWYSHRNPMGMYTSRRTRKRMSCCYELVYVNANYIPEAAKKT